MPSYDLLLANAKFLLGWFLIAWIITFIDLQFLRTPPGKGIPDLKPWSISGLFGIFFAPFLHRSWGHLQSNTLPLFILGGLILLRYPLDFIVITLTITLVSSVLGWFLGRTAGVIKGRIINVTYAGMSRLIFGYAGFLIALFYFDRTVASAIVLVITLFLYANRYRLMLPDPRVIRARISWDGHLIGFIVGAFVAAYLPSLRPLSLSLLQTLNLPTQFPGIMIGGTLINETFYRQQLPPLIMQYGPALLSKLLILLQGVLAAWVLAFVDFMFLKGGLRNNFGIRPWTFKGLLGIVFAPLLHVNWDHLANNTIWFVVFSSIIALVKPGDFVVVTLGITLISGALIWLTAFSGVYVGASALIFGYIGFLLSLFYFENSMTAALLLGGTLLVLVLIDLIWLKIKPMDLILMRKPSFIKQILPKTLDSSWGHFLGFLAGVIVAAYLPALRTQFLFLTGNFKLPL